ncbi:MAG: NAD-dependent malic enzyme [Polyangiales bacterium]
MDKTAALSVSWQGDVVEVPLAGHLLLERPYLNKGTAFSDEERTELHLHGLVSPEVQTLEQQVSRAYTAYQRKASDFDRHVYLRQLQEENSVLFYRLVIEHLEEMIPILYTPTVATAAQHFSEIFHRPRGLFIAYPNRHRIDEILRNAGLPDVSAVIVTDGERVLGLGDQGVGAMALSIGKASLYTACAGLLSARVLPVVLDVGTDNKQLLEDPLYLGWRHPRIRGEEYEEFVEAFVEAVQRRYPNALLQWESFSKQNAATFLDRYRDRLCSFNDDIQGTAAVTTGAILAAVKAGGLPLHDHRIVILGAGSAGCGIAYQLVQAMIRDGCDEEDAKRHVYVVDREGLLHDGLPDLTKAQCRVAQKTAAVEGFDRNGDGTIDLLEAVQKVKATILVGVSGSPGAFTEEVVRAVASHARRPILFPLSSPASRLEGHPADLIAWTDGRGIVATGIPFRPVQMDDHAYPIAHCNNAYIFPSIAVGVMAVGAKRVTDSMFMAASEALAKCSPLALDEGHELLPPMSQIREVSRKIARAVAAAAQVEGVARHADGEKLDELLAGLMWEPKYFPVRAKR